MCFLLRMITYQAAQCFVHGMYHVFRRIYQFYVGAVSYYHYLFARTCASAAGILQVSIVVVVVNTGIPVQ